MNTGARCKTCGGEPPHHRPSILDPNGVGDPGHTMPKESIPISQPRLKEQEAILYPGQTQIELPDDMQSLLWLNIRGTLIKELTIRGRLLIVERTDSDNMDHARVSLQYWPKEQNKNGNK